MNELLFCGHAFFVLVCLMLLLRFQEKGLIAFISCSWLMANIFATKQVLLFGLEVISSDVYTIGAMFGVALLQERYGKESAKLAISLSALLLCFVGIASMLHLAYTPAPHDAMHSHFAAIFRPAPRLMLASLVSFLISQHCEVALYELAATRTEWPFAIRSCLAIVVSQLLDTVCVTFLGLYGIVYALWDIIAVSYAIKLLVIALTSPLLLLSTRIMARENR